MTNPHPHGLLFIDRDGTLVEEPADEQVDSFEKLRFKPGVFRHLAHICEATDYELVLVSNQDGRGTEAFPEEDFLPVHQFIMQTLADQGIRFREELIDNHFPEDNAPTRKPGTGMVRRYMDDKQWDMTKCYVIGDRDTDRQLARNMGCQALILGDDMTWADIDRILTAPHRTAEVRRTTRETDIRIAVDLDNPAPPQVETGLGFFNHMLEQIGYHGQISLVVEAAGDLHVDEHHTIEDTAIVLGQALREALGDKRGIGRYGFTLPMDDSLCTVALDFGGRPWLNWNVTFRRERIGDVPTEMFMHFFKSLSDAAQMNLYVEAHGDNEHHKIEGIFKAFARSVRQAVRRDLNDHSLPSSKGTL